MAIFLVIPIQTILKQFKIMKKKLYERPTMKVIILKHHAQLLAGSVKTSATMSNVWEEEDI